MNRPNQPGYALRMSTFFAAFFFPFGVYLPFFGLWLNNLDFSAEEIGLVLTIPMITRVLFTPFVAAIADKIGDRRLALQIYCMVFALSFSLIMLDDSLMWIALIMAVSHIAQSGIVPVADSLAMAGARRYDIDYGKMRSIGSAAFVSANLVGGFALESFGAGKIIWLMVLGNILMIIFSFTLPTDPRRVDNKQMTKGTALNWSQLRQFGQSGFWIILLAAGLLQGAHGLLYGFAALYWEAIGISARLIGLLWSVSVLAEVLLFASSKRFLTRFGWKSLLMIAALASLVRWSLMPMDLGVTGFFALQVLHAGSFASAHLGTMIFLSEFVDDDLSGTAQGLHTMLTGLLLALVTLISGPLYAQFHGEAFFAMTLVAFVAIGLLFLSPLFSLGHINAHTAPEKSESGKNERE